MAVPELDGRAIVFVVGAPRSGTTWLQRLLASHPNVRTGQESELFSKYVGPLVRAWQAQVSEETATGRGGIGLPCYFTEDEYFASLKRYLGDLLDTITIELGPEDLFLEKTPDHAQFISEIKLLLPSSRFIHVIRDPRDVTASMLAASRGWGKGWAPDTAGLAAARWRTLVSQARSAGRRLSRDDYREVHYEELRAAPVTVLSDLSRFLGLSWETKAIEAAVAANRASTVRHGGGTPIEIRGEFGRGTTRVAHDPPGFMRSGREGGWSEDLSLREKFDVWRKVRRSLDSYGYSWPISDWLSLPGRPRARATRARD